MDAYDDYDYPFYLSDDEYKDSTFEIKFKFHFYSNEKEDFGIDYLKEEIANFLDEFDGYVYFDKENQHISFDWENPQIKFMETYAEITMKMDVKETLKSSPFFREENFYLADNPDKLKESIKEGLRDFRIGQRYVEITSLEKENSHIYFYGYVSPDAKETYKEKIYGKTVCFTGRRPKDLCGYNREAYQDFVKDLTDFLDKEFYANGVRQFITGGAQGFDQLAFWSVNHLVDKYNNIEMRQGVYQKNERNLQNILFVPFDKQSSAWGKDGVFSQKEYQQMLEKTTNIHNARYRRDWYILSEIDNTDKKQVVEAMHFRNHAMVDNSSIVVALYPDDTWQTNRKSGTSETMRYAHEQGKTICQICYEIKDNKLLFGNVKYIEGKKKEQEISNEEKENDEMER